MYIEKVKEFMTLFNQSVVDKPAIMPEDRNKLRIALIFEELKEYAEASGLSDYFSELCIHNVAEFNKPFNIEYVPVINLIEQLDALLDLQYVLSGAVLENGFGNIFDEGFDEVHRSNMSKACNTEEEAIATVEKYKEDGVKASFEMTYPTTVYSMATRKVLKSINYSPANLLPIIEQ